MGRGLPGAWGWRGLPWGNRAVSAAKAVPLSQAESRADRGAARAAPAPDIKHLPGAGMGQGWARTSAHGWAWFCGVHGWASQGCGELEAGPAVASLGQELMVLRGWNGVLGPGLAQGKPEGGRVGIVRAVNALNVLLDGLTGKRIYILNFFF